MKNKLLTISKIGLLAFTILVSQACQEDYEMVDPPLIMMMIWMKKLSCKKDWKVIL
jgi:hypothetical protein